MTSRKLIVIITTSVLAAVLMSNCVGLDNTYMYIQYEAYYNESLNITAIEKVFSEDNITIDYKNPQINAISFEYGEGFNNASVEPTNGILYLNYSNKQYRACLNIELAGSKYPRPHWTEDSNKINEIRKPILRESMNYITDLIYQATGSTPVYNEFHTGDGAQIS